VVEFWFLKAFLELSLHRVFQFVVGGHVGTQGPYPFEPCLESQARACRHVFQAAYHLCGRPDRDHPCASPCNLYLCVPCHNLAYLRRWGKLLMWCPKHCDLPLLGLRDLLRLRPPSL
jgi:hypothetical protein